jgi:hypothetical protein
MWKFSDQKPRMVKIIHLHLEDMDERKISLVPGDPVYQWDGWRELLHEG